MVARPFLDPDSIQASAPIPIPVGPLYARWILLAITLLTFSYLWTAPPLYEAHGSCAWDARPLVCASFRVGPASWFHAENLGLHLVNTALALALFMEMMPLFASLLGAIWFALHPLQAEAVSLVAARPELLATFFALLAVRAWMRDRPWWALAWFAPSLLCGGTAAALPLFLLLLHISRRKPVDDVLPVLASMSMMSSVAVIWAALANHGEGAVQQVLAAGPALGHFARLLALPAGFSILPTVEQSAALQFVAWMTIGLLIGAAFSAFHHLRLGFWFIAFLVLLAPASVLFSNHEAVADQRMYLPMLAVAAMAGRVLESTQFPPLLAAGTVLLAGLTYARGNVWQSEQALWEEAAHESPSQARPRLELARLAPPRRALELLLEAKALYPENAQVAAQLGATYLALKLPSDAVLEYSRALEASPGVAELHLGRGQALAALNLHDAALTDFETAFAINPCYPPARAALHLPSPEGCAK